jgi:hypothetical protein
MNTKNLAKNYNQLTPRERVSLILAAVARADDVERQRLLDAAPSVALRASHHYGLGEALIQAAQCHMMSLLDLAMKYRQWWSLLGWRCFRLEADKEQGGASGKRAAVAAEAVKGRLCSQARYHAFLFITHIDGWKQFCSELPIDADVLLEVMPGWQSLKLVEAEARGAAFSRDDVMMFRISQTIDESDTESERVELPPAPTVEELAKGWHRIVNEQAEEFPGRATH